MEETTIDKVKDPDEIDLIALVKTAWKGRKTIIWCTVVGMGLGLFIAFTSPKVYTASTILVPQIQSQDSRLGNLSSLASLAGFNLNDMTKAPQELSPLVYPEIVKSIPFQREIMDTKYSFKKIGQPVSLMQYYQDFNRPGLLANIKKYTLGLPGVILKALRPFSDTSTTTVEGKLWTMTPEQKGIHEMLNEQLSLNVDDKNGYITLNANAPEPLVAAQIAQKAQELLQKKITEYKIDKAEQTRAFVQDRFNEKKKEFEQAQDRLARFRDRNQNLGNALARTDEELLQAQYQVAFTVYTELAKQLENAKIKVKEETPVFAIIEPVSVPLEKSKPKKAMILVFWVFLGGIVGLGWIFGKHYLVDIKKKWKETE